MSKTVDELLRIFKAAVAAEPWSSIPDYDARRAGIVAVVRALREDARSVIDVEAMLEKILGDAGDEVAEDPLPHLSEREKSLFVAALKGDAGPITPPATNPAPAVCVWTDVGEKYWSGCGRSHFAWTSRDGVVVCPHCKAPIKFTEAKT